MWWGFIVGLVFVYPIVETFGECQQRWSDRKRLAEMRKHVELKHSWDVRRGQWVA
jgi:hypothetical protein